MHAQAVYANAMPAFMRLLAHGMLVGFLLLQAASARAEETPAIIGSTTPLEQATDFKAQPLAILSKFPEAGTAMARFVAQAVMRDPGALDAILSVMDIASPEQMPPRFMLISISIPLTEFGTTTKGILN